jgi:hypothetical protein
MTTKDFAHELKTERMTDIVANRQFKPAIADAHRA